MHGGLAKKEYMGFVCGTCNKTIIRQKNIEIPTVEEWIVKMLEFAEMAKLAYLIRDKIISTSYGVFFFFLLKMEKKINWCFNGFAY